MGGESDSGALGRGGRRVPRPTIKFLRLLPMDSFSHARDAQAIKGRRWAELSLGDIQHPLIDDAKKAFANGLPDKHESSSRSSGRTVYEVRSRSGAAWRGAVILDDYGDPWLIWASKHDEFNSHAKNVLTREGIQGWLPAPAEYKLRMREEAETAARAWKREAIQSILKAIADAVHNGSDASVAIDAPEPGDPVSINIAFEHDAPAESPEQGETLASIFFRVANSSQAPYRDDLLACVLPLLQPERDKIDSTFDSRGQLDIWITLTHAKLTQLLALDAIAATDEQLDVVCSPNTHLHYVATADLVSALVTGSSSRAVCGRWFVPTKDERAGLPICPDCEEQKPLAQEALRIIRAASD